MPNLLQILRYFLVALLRFCLRKVARKSKFSECFTSMVAAFIETGAPTSRLYVAQQGVIIPILLETF